MESKLKYVNYSRKGRHKVLVGKITELKRGPWPNDENESSVGLKSRSLLSQGKLCLWYGVEVFWRDNVL